MELYIDEWHDWWRLGIFVISISCLILLLSQFTEVRKTWSEKQRDRWFMMLMWILAAAEIQVEALFRDTPLRFRLVFVTAACLVTLRLLTKKSYADEPVSK